MEPVLLFFVFFLDIWLNPQSDSIPLHQTPHPLCEPESLLDSTFQPLMRGLNVFLQAVAVPDVFRREFGGRVEFQLLVLVGFLLLHSIRLQVN